MSKLYILCYLYKIKNKFYKIVDFVNHWGYNKSIKGLRPAQKTYVYKCEVKKYDQKAK